MGIPLRQQVRVGAYVLKQRLLGRDKYPLVLMLEPLFRCNLACAGCGKIDYPTPILNRRLSVQECLDAAEECGAPIVSIPGGEPLIHKDIAQIVKGLTARRKFVYLCTNALLVEKKIDLFEPSPYLTFSIHLDGLREQHDRSVCKDGVFERAVAAIRLLRGRGFRVGVNATLFDGAAPDSVAGFFDYVTDELGVEGITVSPGYAYERAPDQTHFLNRRKTKELFRAIFRRGQERPRARAWQLSHSSLYLDFLAGNQQYRCTPWGNPTRNVFGWQRPCYLLGEGYAASFRELMEQTDWNSYGTGNYEKCADCMAHCGYEATAVSDALAHPLKALKTRFGRIRTEGPMAPEIPLEAQRPAAFVHDQLVSAAVARLPERQKPHSERSHAA
jgi:hopanoid biosynthesis associated radical SAM protein HpnH